MGLAMLCSPTQLPSVHPLAPIPLESSLDCRGEGVGVPVGLRGVLGLFPKGWGTGPCQVVWHMHQIGLDETPETLEAFEAGKGSAAQVCSAPRAMHTVPITSTEPRAKCGCPV